MINHQQTSGTRDLQVDAMSAIGIIFVVLGHNYQPENMFFPAYAFHMALFFFISGYMFKSQASIRGKFVFILNKVRTQLVPYYIIQSLVVGLMILLSLLSLFPEPHLTLHDFFIEPFYTGHQLQLMIPLWFLLQIFVLNIVFQLIYLVDNRFYILLVLLITIFIALGAAKKGLAYPKGFDLLVVRTCIAAMFFQIGIFVSLHRDKVAQVAKDPFFLLAAFAFVSLLKNVYGKIHYSIVWGSVENSSVHIPLISSAVIVLIVYGVAGNIASAVKSSSLFFKIGRDSFWIMSFHLMGFLVVNMVLFGFGLIDGSNLANAYFNYAASMLFPVYFAAGLFLPLLFAYITRNYLLPSNLPNLFFMLRPSK